MKVRLASPITYDSIVDGPGLRMVIWTQGCIHNCDGCHNPQTHALDAGYELDHEELIQQLKESRLQKGITLSGGDPFLQAKALIPVAAEAKKLGLDVWAYTGFCWEFLMHPNNPSHIEHFELLQYVDTLVDGRFMKEKKSVDLTFRGSSNQRIIDVQKSLKEKVIICRAEYM